MDPAVLGGRLASSMIAPLLKKLFRSDAPGAGLVDKPVRLSALVSFKGEKRTLNDRDVRALAAQLVTRAVESPGERPFPEDEQDAVTDALTRRLLALGDLDMDDVQAVRLGHRELAARLRGEVDGLSTDAGFFLDSATEWACLHILEFFTRRSTFVARTLVEQSRDQAALIAKVDALLARTPRPPAPDTAFERRYLTYVADRHNHLTIYGLDLRDSPDRWPLEVAYLSLEATGEETGFDGPATGTPVHLPAEQALRDHDRVLLRGDAGSGKTTLVQWLAVTAARDGAQIPYVLPLRTLIRRPSLPAPADFLGAVGCPLTPPEGWADRVLSAGRALILVDGLDEIPAPDRHRARDWLLDLTRAFPGNRWLLTSRPTAVRQDWLAAEGFRELLLAPMRREEVATFVSRWHTAAGAPEYEGPLLDSLRVKRDLARLATNPLMCGLICALHRERRGYLPTGRKELYDAALAMLLARRDRERGMGAVDAVELGEEAQLELLQRLAYALVLSGRTEMDAATAEGIVERCLPVVAAPPGMDARSVLSQLLLRSGLLRRPAEGVIDFVHRTFQDYLGARYAVEEGHLDVLLSHADDTQWEDVIRLAVAHARPRERAAVLRRLLARETPRLTLLALASLEHAAALDAAVRAEVEKRASELIPPRTTEDARALAEAGPLVLELLPGPQGLADEAAHGVTVTASLLAADEPDGALAVLRRFREHPALNVRRQLVGTWHRFDAAQYAREVLDHLERDGLALVCKSDEQAATVPLMRPWSRLHVIDALHAPEQLRVPEPAALQHLSLEGMDGLEDLSALTAFSSLSSLWLWRCPSATNLAALAGLGLKELVLGYVADVSGLRTLNGLTELTLHQPLPDRCLSEVLPSEAPLERLLLGSDTLRRSDALRGLRDWPTVSRLILEQGDLTAADWAEIAALPALDTLGLRLSGAHSLDHILERAPCVPQVRRVLLRNVPLHIAPPDLSPVFPAAEIINDPF
ncbi:NACHT domain-containing protein [Streptomyces sp. enrichment culture]|uniref:NACHT domain-containing protein n=1 Tax=Streptomyces sp. enrichment culture TaxID=1795815 RepID=UPI003F56CEE3